MNTYGLFCRVLATIAFVALLLPQEIAKPASSQSIDTSWQTLGTKLYITSRYAHKVLVLDTSNNSIVATIPIGYYPQGIAMNPRGTRAYTADTGSDKVSVVDPAGNSLVTTISVGNDPVIPVVSPDGTRVYVTNIWSNSISVIETSSNAVVHTISNVAYPWGIAISPDGTKIAATEYVNGRIAVFDTSSFSRIATVKVGAAPEGLIYHPNGSKIYVANLSSDTVSVIDTGIYSVIQTISVGDGPVQFDFNSNASRLYVANNYSANVSEIDVRTGKVLRTFSVGAGPIDVEVVDQYLYVTNHDSNSLSVVNLNSGATVKTIGDLNGPHSIAAAPASLPNVVTEARLDIGMPYNQNRGCPSPYAGCGGPYHGFYKGVCTDLVMDAYNAGVPFNIQNALYQDHRTHPGRYRYGTARNAEDMRRYFNHNQQLLSHSQPYQVGDIAFFDWNKDGLTNHVNVISEVDASGRPLRMVDATGIYAGNPSGRALEHSWNSYYDQHVQAHGRLSSGVATFLSSSATTETLQVLRVTVDSPSVTLRLQDMNGRSTSDTYDENLVASNVESFIPYIPGGAYADLGTGKVISVTQPLSNTTQYLVELTGEASAQYHLSIQTLQDGGVTASAYFTESITLGETQGITLQLSAPGGVINFVASTPATMPKVSVTPGEIEMTGLPGTLAQTAITITETGGQQALNGVSASILDVMNQNGQVVAGTLFTVTPANFSVPAGGSQSIQLKIDLSGIQPGIYQGSLLVVSNNGGSRSIPLSLVVRPFDVFLPITLKSAP